MTAEERTHRAEARLLRTEERIHRAEERIGRAEARIQRREQEIELYTAMLGILADLPPGGVVADAFATDEAQRIHSEWELVFGCKARTQQAADYVN